MPKIRQWAGSSDFQKTWENTVQACAKAGFAVVQVRPPKGCRASGATFFLRPNHAVLMLSDQHPTDDQSWFSFFHEAGHLILHSKKLLFIEGTGDMDIFAANILSLDRADE